MTFLERWKISGMTDPAFHQLTLQEKAAFIQKRGTFIEGVDFYSFRILLYSFQHHRAELTFDYSNNVVNIEFVENRPENDILPRLDSSFEGLLD